MLEKDYRIFNSEYNGNLKKAKFVNSTIHKNLLDEDPQCLILAKCPPSELHILQGFVNHVFFDGLVNVIGYEKALNFPKLFNAISKHYHGDCFEGTACREI